MSIHFRRTTNMLVGALLIGAALLAVAPGGPTAALAAPPKPTPAPRRFFPDQPLHKRFKLPTPTVPEYALGEPYAIPGQAGQYVTLTTADGKEYVIPAPPYEHGGSWGSFPSYDYWATQFRSQNRGKAPTPIDEINFWWSQANAGVKVTAPQVELPAGMPAPAGYLASRGSSGALDVPSAVYAASAPPVVASYVAPPLPDLYTNNPYAVLFRSFLGAKFPPIWGDLAAAESQLAHFPQSLADIPGN